MAHKIDEVWLCGECSAPVMPEEAEEIRIRIRAGECQIEFSCEECCVGLTADTTDCPDGEVSINPDWVYS